jgi:hypothetical protein
VAAIELDGSIAGISSLFPCVAGNPAGSRRTLAGSDDNHAEFRIGAPRRREIAYSAPSKVSRRFGSRIVYVKLTFFRGQYGR